MKRRLQRPAASPPAAGEAAPGAPVEPAELPAADAPATGRAIAAPMPATPLPDHEVERLKQAAAKGSGPATVRRGQSDPAARKRR